jgi:hypothetical protein
MCWMLLSLSSCYFWSYCCICRGQPWGSPKTTRGILLKNLQKTKTKHFSLKHAPKARPTPWRPRQPIGVAQTRGPSSGLRLDRGLTPPSSRLRLARGLTPTSSGLRLARGLTAPSSGLRLARGITSASIEASARARTFPHAGTDI